MRKTVAKASYRELQTIKTGNEIVTIIPARGGSKGVKNKNIKILNHHPLLAYSTLASQMSHYIDRTIVSTESDEIKEVALKYDAEIPYKRSLATALDLSLDIDWVREALLHFHVTEGKLPLLIVHLRATTPLRDISIIDKAIEYMLDNPDATSLRSVQVYEDTPYKMFKKGGDYLEPYIESDVVKEYYNMPRQRFPKAYHANGYIDIIKPETVLLTGTLHGDKMLAFETPNVTEVDNEEDFKTNEILSKVLCLGLQGELFTRYAEIK